MFRFLSFSGPLQMGFILIFLMAMRLPMLFDTWPLLVEDAQHMVLGERLATGALPYRDVMDTTPPIPAFLYKWLHIFFGRSQKAHFIFSMLLIFVQSLLFRHFCHSKNLLKEKGELPAFIYAILGCMMYDFYSLSPALIALTFILIAFDRIFRHLRSENAENDIFTTGFYIGMAYLCYEPAFLFILMAYYAFVLYTRSSIRYYIIMLCGFVFPVIVSMLIYMVRDGFEGFWEFYIGYIPPKNVFLFDFDISWALCIIAPSLLIVIFGVLKTFTHGRFINFQLISNQIIFIWMIFFLATVVLFFSKTTSAYIFILPFAAFFSTHFFILVKKPFFKSLLLLVYIVNAWAVIYSLYSISPYPVSVLKFNNQLLKDTEAFLSEKNKKILIIGEDFSLYQHGQLSGSFLQWSRVKEKIGLVTSYEQIQTVYEEFRQYPPDVIYDKDTLFEKWAMYMPDIASNYQKQSKSMMYVLKTK